MSQHLGLLSLFFSVIWNTWLVHLLTKLRSCGWYLVLIARHKLRHRGHWIRLPYDILWNRGHWVGLPWSINRGLRHRVWLTGPVTLLRDFDLILLLLSKFVRRVWLVLLRLELQSCLLCTVRRSLAINFVFLLLLFSHFLPFILIKDSFRRLLWLLFFLLYWRCQSHCWLFHGLLLKVTRRVLLHNENRLCLYYVCFSLNRITA